MLNQMSKREKRLVLLTGVVLLLVGGYFGVYDKLQRKWKNLNGEIESLEILREASIKNYMHESRIEKEYDEVVASLQIEGDNTDKQIKILDELNKVMEEAGVIPKNAKFLNIEEAENFQIFNFSFNDTETNMLALSRFLDLLERKSKVSEIQSIDIKPPSPPLYNSLEEQRFKVNFKISRLVYRS